jgi:hypothetical protein
MNDTFPPIVFPIENSTELGNLTRLIDTVSYRPLLLEEDFVGLFGILEKTYSLRNCSLLVHRKNMDIVLVLTTCDRFEHEFLISNFVARNELVGLIKYIGGEMD